MGQWDRGAGEGRLDRKRRISQGERWHKKKRSTFAGLLRVGTLLLFVESDGQSRAYMPPPPFWIVLRKIFGSGPPYRPLFPVWKSSVMEELMLEKLL